MSANETNFYVEVSTINPRLASLFYNLSLLGDLLSGFIKLCLSSFLNSSNYYPFFCGASFIFESNFLSTLFLNKNYFKG